MRSLKKKQEWFRASVAASVPVSTKMLSFWMEEMSQKHEPISSGHMIMLEKLLVISIKVLNHRLASRRISRFEKFKKRKFLHNIKLPIH